MSMNLRMDDTFVEDAEWHTAAKRSAGFLRRCRQGHVLYLELGVGGNTPGIIKYPFWRMTAENPRSMYVCVNDGESFYPQELCRQSVCVDKDIGAVLAALTKMRSPCLTPPVQS